MSQDMEGLENNERLLVKNQEDKTLQKRSDTFTNCSPKWDCFSFWSYLAILRRVAESLGNVMDKHNVLKKRGGPQKSSKATDLH